MLVLSNHQAGRTVPQRLHRTSGLSSRCRTCESRRGADRVMVRDLKAVVKKHPALAELIVWTGEFGRSPDNGKRGGGQRVGRDHNAKAMAMLLAGGGVNAGNVVGATDELGEKAIECVHPIRNLHVTLLRLLGLDDNKLTYFHGGRFKQLSQTGGKFIPELIG